MSRLNVNPTRMELKKLKARLTTAVRGHKLLKDKSDEMVRRFSVLIRENKRLRDEVETELSQTLKLFAAARSVTPAYKAEAAFAAPSVLLKAECGTGTIMGVDVPQITLESDNGNCNLPYAFTEITGEADYSVERAAQLLPKMVKLAEGTNVLVPAGIDQDFKITPNQLRDAITARTRLIIICSPSNPTGSVYTRDELQGLVDVLKDYPDITIIADEIYQHINFTGSFTSLGAFPEIADRVVVVNGVSKAYAMTGWRIGFIAAPMPVAKAVTKLQSQYTSNPSSVAQKAAEAAYNGPQDCVEEMRVAFERRRNLVVELAKEIPGIGVNVPQGAFYLFPKVSSYFGKKYGDRVISNDSDLAMYLLEEGHVATVAGEAFCLPGYIRLSYATSDDNIREAMRRIAEALAKLS